MKKQVLLVDPKSTSRIEYREMLEMAGCEVTPISSFPDAMQRFRSESFDAVLLDEDQGALTTGKELAKLLRRMKSVPVETRAPFILLVGSDSRIQPDPNIDLQLVKPFNVDGLKAVLDLMRK